MHTLRLFSGVLCVVVMTSPISSTHFPSRRKPEFLAHIFRQLSRSRREVRRSIPPRRGMGGVCKQHVDALMMTTRRMGKEMCLRKVSTKVRNLCYYSPFWSTKIPAKTPFTAAAALPSIGTEQNRKIFITNDDDLDEQRYAILLHTLF